jgi:hypothetical protein
MQRQQVEMTRFDLIPAAMTFDSAGLRKQELV